MPQTLALGISLHKYCHELELTKLQLPMPKDSESAYEVLHRRPVCTGPIL